jgi:hypothetical protein
MHHCANCAYAQEVAAEIRRSFPQVGVTLIDLEDPAAVKPTSSLLHRPID